MTHYPNNTTKEEIINMIVSGEADYSGNLPELILAELEGDDTPFKEIEFDDQLIKAGDFVWCPTVCDEPLLVEEGFDATSFMAGGFFFDNQGNSRSDSLAPFAILCTPNNKKALENLYDADFKTPYREGKKIYCVRCRTDRIEVCMG